MSFDNPKVIIVGAGAMGGLFGGLLAEGGLDVTLVDVWPEHVAAINANGVHIVGAGGERSVPVRATTSAADVTAADVVIFQCKAYANEAAAKSIRHIFTSETQTAAISFQNGLGSEEMLGRVLGADRIIGGLTAQGGLVEAPGVVRNFGDLPTYIGELSGGASSRTEAIAASFTRHGLPTMATADIRREKWRKLLGNVGLGAISAVTDMRSIEIMAVPELRGTVLRLVDEAADVAKAEGIDLDVEEARSVLMQISDTRGGGTGQAKSSMREDIIRGRLTEIDTIHGAVAQLARKHGIATPTLDAMVGLVKGVEQQSLAKVNGR
ncbi:MAG: ketopantoate reductase family protein [Hyphomicrobiaceae bacterium]